VVAELSATSVSPFAPTAKRAGDTITGLEMMQSPDGSGYLPVAKRKNGSVSMAGSYMRNENQAPPGTTPQEWAALVAQYPEAELEGQLPNGTKIRKAPVKQTAAKPNISWQTSADGLTKIPYETVTDPKTGQPVLRKVKIMDENGDGIDDATQGGAAAGWQSWAEQ